ncbi:hypothetical protein Q4577_13910 [Marinovum sp. 2_MG-2023]|uniref:COG3904 family protein n=1 Tax=unclassified Marinovum TaxID=2647166 RepID=UPI0026E2AC4A|nr:MULTISPECIES: hypothetical protein [unclassified Marinovum]MDO6731124.1 hypothetical protein [Marinovum sp. 2_MG-2023]MDO6778621.1 hypothetical protein [Marinovum sp. 1_MG-2023]
MTGGGKIRRILTAVLVFQLALGALLVLGDVQRGGLRLPKIWTNTPRLSEPIRPGDQRRVFDPRRDRPAVSPIRDPGDLPKRLVLSPVTDTTQRLEGAIAEGDAERIITQLAAADPRPERLILQSPGGAVQEALALGRHLHDSGIATEMLAGEFCYSACPYLLAGGATRDIHPDASVGVHQHYFGESSLLPAFVAVEDIQRGQADVMQYLSDMGIDPLVMRHALATPPDEIYVLLPQELDTYGFTTNAPAN